jgi:putative inorganic carbon (hco3(-)) transporter
MRDILIATLVLLGSVAALRRPWIGIMVWTWLSIMNPHRFSYGWSYNAPLAAVVACATLTGLLISGQRESPFKGAPVPLLVLFMGWITLSWLFGLDRQGDYEQWLKAMKIDLMILVALSLLRTKRHIISLVWVAAGSLALLGAKGGLFTLVTGGTYRVWGPPDSFIEDNNEFALALVMTIPLLRFLQTQLQGRFARHGMTLVMVLCAAAAVGSYSRGAVLALIAMTLFLWWRGRNRTLGGIVILGVAISLLAFMPDMWEARMSTIGEYEQDRSAMGRISAWWNAWNLAFHYPFGVGFDAARPELFARFSPYPDFVHAAHSIYFQVLGNHGFIGLFIFLSMFATTWHSASWLRDQSDVAREAKWTVELGATCQASLLGYFTGGALLSLSYFDLPYDVLVVVVAARAWVARKAWESEANHGTPATSRPAIARVGRRAF